MYATGRVLHVDLMRPLTSQISLQLIPRGKKHVYFTGVVSFACTLDSIPSLLWKAITPALIFHTNYNMWGICRKGVHTNVSSTNKYIHNSTVLSHMLDSITYVAHHLYYDLPVSVIHLSYFIK